MGNFTNPGFPPDPIAVLQQTTCGSLPAQPLPERGGTLCPGAGGWGCGCADSSFGSGPTASIH
jgi:hypothetical protein